jgi:hypothetical protein
MKKPTTPAKNKNRQRQFNPNPYSPYWELWKHMADNHNCILLDSECEDICRVVEKTRLPLLTRHISGDLVVMCALEAMSGTASSSERAKFTERLLERLHHSEFEASRAAEQNTKNQPCN